MNTPDGNIGHGTGFAGTIFSVFAVMISMLPELEVWFRIVASLSAIVAAWVSIYVMLSKMNKEKRK